MKKYWGQNEELDKQALKSELKDIIKMIRFKLITTTSGTQDEYLMKKNIRHQFFSDKTRLSVEDLDSLLIRLHMPLAHRYVKGLFSMFAARADGTIEFEEFERFILYEPFS